MTAEDELRLDRPVVHLRGLFLRPRAKNSVSARVTTAEIVVPLSRACARTRPASAAGSLTVNTTLASGTCVRPYALARSAYRRACRAETPNRAASTRAASAAGTPASSRSAAALTRSACSPARTRRSPAMP